MVDSMRMSLSHLLLGSLLSSLAWSGVTVQQDQDEFLRALQPSEAFEDPEPELMMAREEVLSKADFQVPRQPVDFSQFLQPKFVSVFEQISTSRLDPRFATAAQAAGASDFNEFSELHHVDVQPEAGTLVLFDSVSMPHLVREVTGSRQRIAASGWFHEDSVFPS